MNISDLDFLQVDSHREIIVGAAAFSDFFAEMHPVFNSNGDLVGTVVSLALSEANGPQATGFTSGFATTSILSNGSTFTNSGSNSSSSITTGNLLET